MGVVYTKNLYTQNGWIPESIEMFLKIHVGPDGMRGGYATFESAGNVRYIKINQYRLNEIQFMVLVLLNF